MMAVFGCGNVIRPRLSSTADNDSLAQSVFRCPAMTPRSLMALSATAAVVLVDHPLRQLGTVHPDFLRCQEPIAQIPDRHSTGSSLGRCRPWHSSRLQIVPLVGILRHRRFRIIPPSEVVELPLDCLDPQPVCVWEFGIRIGRFLVRHVQRPRVS